MAAAESSRIGSGSMSTAQLGRSLDDMWAIDSIGAQIYRVHCEEADDRHWMLRLPAGARVSAGQRLELCSQRPGQAPPPGAGFCRSVSMTVLEVDSQDDESGREQRVLARASSPLVGRSTAPAH